MDINLTVFFRAVVEPACCMLRVCETIGAGCMKTTLSAWLLSSVMGCAVGAYVWHPAQAATFRSQPILLLGSAQVIATGINDQGTIIGSTQTSQNGYGFVLQGATLSTLPSAYPTAINQEGAVTGFSTSQGAGFLWENGAFVPNVNFQPGIFNGQRLGPVINRHGELAYSTSSGNTQLAFAGFPGHFHAQHKLSPDSAIVSSINDHGEIAGFEHATIQGQLREAVFAGKHGLFDLLLTPGNQNVEGGFVNNAGQVAFTDGVAGYLAANGAIVSFNVPSQGYNVQVQAINDKGRVVGVFVDGSQTPPVQRGFFYNGSVVSVFGSYPATDIVKVALNGHAAMVVSDIQSNGQSAVSFRVRCTGTGC
jgi:hypothetical protein